MFAPRALVIKRWELGKLCVFGGEITLRVDRKFAHPISATFIHGYDLAFADVGDCVGAFQNLERFAGLIVDLEILRNSQRVPDCRIFRPKTIEREPTSFLPAHFAELIQKRDDIQKPDGVLLVRVLKIKKRIVTWSANFRAFNLGIVRPAHRLREADQLRFFAADRPIVTVTAERDNPLFRVAAFKQHVQPTLKPRPRPKRPGRIDVRCFVEERGDEPIDVIRELVEIDVIKLLARLNCEPKFLVVVVQRVAKPVDERSDVFFVNGIDLFPVDHDPRSFRVAQRPDHFCEEAFLSIRRTVREIFHRFRLPRVPYQIRQQWHQFDSFARAKFWQPNVGIDRNITEAVYHRDPFWTQMRDQRRVLFERCVTVGIAVGIKREAHFVRRRFLARLCRRRGRRGCSR